MKHTMGDKIRQLRERAGMTQEGLARASGLTTSSISKIERGSSVRLDTAEKIAKALAVQTSEILGG